MAVYTVIGEFELARLLEQFPIGKLVGTSPIAKGSVNSNFAVESASGRYFFRLNEGKAESDVAYEAALVSHLGSRGVKTPKTIATSTGAPFLTNERGYFSLFEWIDGFELDAAGVTAEHAHAVGAALAKVHLAAADFQLRRLGGYTFELIAERFRTFEHSDDSALSKVISVLGEELAWLSLCERERLPRGVIHQDLFRDNVLWRAGEASPTIAALIDFEQACDGAFAYDLAVILNDWCWDGHFLPERLRKMVAGYNSVRPLSAVEQDGLWTEARAAAARFTVTRISDFHLKTAAGGRVEKDFRRYWARLEELRQMGGRGFAALVF